MINAEKFKNVFGLYATELWSMPEKEFLEWLNAEIQPERKKGKWIWNENAIDWGIGAWECNKCGFPAEAGWATTRSNNPMMYAGGHYCGCCGARMEGVEEYG